MTAFDRENSDVRRRKREIPRGLERAIADIVCRRWPSNTVHNVMAEWGLSDGQARGVVYGSASRSTINTILHHKRGGARLGLELIEAVTGQFIEQVIAQDITRLRKEERRLGDEAAQLEALERGIVQSVGSHLVGGMAADLRRASVRAASPRRELASEVCA